MANKVVTLDVDWASKSGMADATIGFGETFDLVINGVDTLFSTIRIVLLSQSVSDEAAMLWVYLPETYEWTEDTVTIRNVRIYTQPVLDMLKSQGGKAKLYLSVASQAEDGHFVDYGVSKVSLTIGSYLGDQPIPPSTEISGITIGELKGYVEQMLAQIRVLEEGVNAAVKAAGDSANEAKGYAAEANGVREVAVKASQDAGEAKQKAEVAEQVAKGAQYAKVFDTEAEMKAWAAAEMAKAEDQREVKVGDNLYIKELEVPDYWWTGKDDGYAQLETGAVRIYVDTALDANSTNPVQNKAVKAALDGKQDKLCAGDGILITEEGVISTTGGGSQDALSVLMRDGFGGEDGLIVNGTSPVEGLHYHLLAGRGLTDATPHTAFYVDSCSAGVIIDYDRYPFTKEMFCGGGGMIPTCISDTSVKLEGGDLTLEFAHMNCSTSNAVGIFANQYGAAVTKHGFSKSLCSRIFCLEQSGGDSYIKSSQAGSPSDIPGCSSGIAIGPNACIVNEVINGLAIGIGVEATRLTPVIIGSGCTAITVNNKYELCVGGNPVGGGCGSGGSSVDMKDNPFVSDIFCNDFRDNPNGYAAVYDPNEYKGIGAGFVNGEPVIRWNTGSAIYTYPLGGCCSGSSNDSICVYDSEAYCATGIGSDYVAIGDESTAYSDAVAVGARAYASSGEVAIGIGAGNNSNVNGFITENSLFNVRRFRACSNWSGNELFFATKDDKAVLGGEFGLATNELGSTVPSLCYFYLQDVADMLATGGGGGASGYPYVNLIGAGVDIRPQDRAINVVEWKENVLSPVAVCLPAEKDVACDFIIVSRNTPSDFGLVFYRESDTPDKTVSLLPCDGDDSHLVPEEGTNVFMFTEIMPNIFMVSRKKVVEPTEVTA